MNYFIKKRTFFFILNASYILRRTFRFVRWTFGINALDFLIFALDF
jgi:hypothetical protein